MKPRSTLTKKPRYPTGGVRPSQPAPSASEPSIVAANPDAAARSKLIAAEAYLLAERRGFAPGAELEDWLAAEAIVEERLQKGRSIGQREHRRSAHHGHIR